MPRKLTFSMCNSACGRQTCVSMQWICCFRVKAGMGLHTLTFTLFCVTLIFIIFFNSWQIAPLL